MTLFKINIFRSLCRSSWQMASVAAMLVAAVSVVALPVCSATTTPRAATPGSEDTISIYTVRLADRYVDNLDTVEVEPSILFLPLIFDGYEEFDDPLAPQAPAAAGSLTLETNSQWLEQAQRQTELEHQIRYRLMIDEPQLTRYNTATLPAPPEQQEIDVDPSTRLLTVEAIDIPDAVTLADDPETETVKLHNWLHSLDASMQFSQAYLSDNWYQGGNNNLNFIGNFLWNVKLNTNVYPNLLFDTSVQYKIGISSAPDDSIRSYSISEDLFQITSKFGYKAAEKWYYSITFLFKTQFLNNYESNTNDMTAAFLTPGEMNVGLGMTYSTTSKDGYLAFDASLSPFSYNMKICRENEKVDPTDYGIDEGHHVAHDFGSSVEGKITWKITPAISWTSRLYAFTSYSYLQGDWENTFEFYASRYLSTQFYVHLRYDKSASRDPDWHYWQFKEILSFGLSYKFSME